MRVLIDSGVGPTDYTRYITDGSLTIEDSINVPTLISFQLNATDNSFVVPRRSSYITILSDIYAEGGGYGSGKILATGFITVEPERTFLGVGQRAPGNKFYTYSISATSDEWFLNTKPISFIPAFVNQTDSQILKTIAEVLRPNFFDTSGMALGTIVPYYQYDPAQTWSDIAKTFADSNRYHYKVINKKISYQPFGDLPLGIAYDDTVMKESQLAPLEMKTGVVSVPPVNDCIVIGDTEPQSNCDDYFVGDGFTSNFVLKHKVFDGTANVLLQDDWTEAAFQQGAWNVNDPLSVFVLADNNGNPVGGLNVIQKGATGVYTPQTAATYIQAINGLELGGGISLQHGQVTFNDTAAGGGGIIGGVYGVNEFIPGNCIAGFGVTGQQAFGPYAVYQVEITSPQTHSVNLYLTSPQQLTIFPGNVIQCSGFTASGNLFLNDTKLAIKSVEISHPRLTGGSGTTWVYKITCLSTALYANVLSNSEEAGIVTGVENDVLVTASGSAGLVIQPILNGQYAGQKIITQVNHQYLLQTWIGANTQTRYTRPYSNLTRSNTYGDQNLAASGAITFVVTDVNLGDYVIEQKNPLFGLFPAAPPPVVTKFTQTGLTLPPFALYCLVNGIDLNVSINYTMLSLPPQGFLTVQSLTGASGGNLPWLPEQLSPEIVYQLGVGQQNQTAQIGQQGDLNVLQFYTDDIPSVGARIRFQSWSSGQSIARVRDSVAVQNEATISGDDGVRSAIMTNLSPLPRSSDECEAAAAAAIHDREYPQFQGSYTVTTVPFRYESLFSPSMYNYPRTGEYLYVNALSRGVSGQNFFVNTVRIQVLELRQEEMTISIDYGPDLFLERLLSPFLEREQNILVPKQTAQTPNYITINEVLNAHLPTLDNARITSQVNSLTGNYVVIDLGVPPVTACEVRNVDSGWGVSNQGRVGLFTTQQFTVPRTSRDQTWYLRTLNGNTFSRFSKKLRVNAPLIPSAPTLVQSDVNKAVFDLTGDVRDIYGLELRAIPVSGVLFYTLPSTPTDSIAQFVRTTVPIDVTATGNVVAVFNPPSNASTFPYGTQLQVGDLVIVSCPNDSSFNGIQIVSQSIPSSAALPPPYPTHVTLDKADAYFFPATHAERSNYGFSRSYPTTPAQSVGKYLNLPSINFNSQNGYNGWAPWIQPMQVDVLDANGIFHGRVPVWSGATAGYEMAVSGSLFFPTAGQYIVTISHDDGMLFGIQGATRVSGLQLDSYSHTKTAMCNLDVLGANNHIGTFINETYIISVSASGSHLFEIDYSQWIDPQYLMVMFNGAPVIPTPPDLSGSPGTPWEFGWFDYGKQVPDTIGSATLNVSNEVGTTRLLIREAFSYTASGEIAANYDGTCTVYTQTPHGFSSGQTIIIGCGWGTWPSNLPTPPQTGTVFCGQQVITNVLSTTGFQFVLSRFKDPNQLLYGSWEQGIAASGVSPQKLSGVCAAMPSPTNFTLASGIILQRPIFAPSDLVVDFTQPDIATTLEILQALSPFGRVAGLNAHFFNLTWDRSAPTSIPSFEIPQIVNISIDGNTQQLGWQVQTGRPTGYRVQVIDPVTGVTYNRFTVDNPNNPQALTQFKLLQQDFQSNRTIVITPFDNLGDGVPSTIANVSVASVTGSQSPGSYTIGCTYNGLIPSGTVLVRIPFDVPVQYSSNFDPSKAYVETAPTSQYVITIYKIPRGLSVASQVEIGSITFGVGALTGVFLLLVDPTNFLPGDVIRVITQNSADATMSDLGLTISGIKN